MGPKGFQNEKIARKLQRRRTTKHKLIRREWKAKLVKYQDLLPVMADKLDVDTFVKELCGGFRQLADPQSN
ncbi:hypothetical protein H5410_011749 [Solanum commersonii]|uniref:Uncharacterized protein n=1 Tax=Solanum commersonii TaxID=4109 RepID=A0A9J6AQK3_SOLCO|nr:hypothetical protein H5410_011749 [Solanum commersonii]